MRLFESFADWLGGIFGSIKELYNSESDLFFISAIIVIVILLLLVVSLSKKAGDKEAKHDKKVDYDDIDWSFHDEEEEVERPAYKPEARKPAATRPSRESEYGIRAEDERNTVRGVEGLSPEIAEALLRSVIRSSGSFEVPNWMAKQTLSLEDIETINAQEWLEEQLREEEAAAHDKAVERATVEKIATILANLEKNEADIFKDPEEMPEPVKAEPVKAEPEPVAQPEPVVQPEPVAQPVEVPIEQPIEEAPEESAKNLQPEPTRVSYDTGTLEKILKEAEELKEEATEEENEIESIIRRIQAGEDEDLMYIDEDEPHDWDIAGTLAKLEKMQAENERLAAELDGGDILADGIGHGPLGNQKAIESPDYHAEPVAPEVPKAQAAPTVREISNEEKLNAIRADLNSILSRSNIKRPEVSEERKAPEPVLERVAPAVTEERVAPAFTEEKPEPSFIDTKAMHDFLRGGFDPDAGLESEIPEAAELRRDRRAIREDLYEEGESDLGRINTDMFGRRGVKVIRFSKDNRDTNRHGRKFTEEELQRQIRD